MSARGFIVAGGLLSVSYLLAMDGARGQSLPNAARGRGVFEARCGLCHAAQGSGGGQGPNLAGVVGRMAGSSTSGGSPALRAAGFRWDADHLDRYLADPGAAVPGTTMPVKSPDPGERQDIIAFLSTLKPGTEHSRPAPAGGSSEASARPGDLLTGADAFGDWHRDAPGVRRRICPADLPAPFSTRSTGNPPRLVERPVNRMPQAPPGFRVDLFSDELENPRVLRVAPNGDVFVAETVPGRIRVLRAGEGATHAGPPASFAEGLDAPFGIAFYPPGPDPHFVYIAETNRIVRFPYRSGDLQPAGPAEVIVPELAATTGGHTTRDIVVSPDASRLFVSIGSGSNVAAGMGRRSLADALAWDAAHGFGAAWGPEAGRADVLSFKEDGSNRRLVATGLRNCVGLAIQPASGDLWCSTNERDGLGDNLVPDYITRVRQGAFYGWPWYYVGGNEEPRLQGQRPDLRGKMTEPDVLLQPHSASLGLTFYTGAAFPPAYRGDVFAAEHGSWNRSERTGYKVIRVRLREGVPTGEYEDFLTGFVVNDESVWGRPVGIATARDGALLVSEDGNNTVWRVSWISGTQK